MILTTHALAGAAIGKNLENPVLIVLLALVVHFILDGFRHGEYFDSRVATIKNTAWKVALDLTIGGALILSYIYFQKADFILTRNILLGVFFSLLPDGITILFWTFKWKFLKQVIAFHSFAHRYTHFPKFSPERQWNIRNAANDILFSLAAIGLIYLF